MELYSLWHVAFPQLGMLNHARLQAYLNTLNLWVVVWRLWLPNLLGAALFALCPVLE